MQLHAHCSPGTLTSDQRQGMCYGSMYELGDGRPSATTDPVPMHYKNGSVMTLYDLCRTSGIIEVPHLYMHMEGAK
jgi:hypothetical protein